MLAMYGRTGRETIRISRFSLANSLRYSCASPKNVLFTSPCAATWLRNLRDQALPISGARIPVREPEPQPPCGMSTSRLHNCSQSAGLRQATPQKAARCYSYRAPKDWRYPGLLLRFPTRHLQAYLHRPGFFPFHHPSTTTVGLAGHRNRYRSRDGSHSSRPHPILRKNKARKNLYSLGYQLSRHRRQDIGVSILDRNPK